MLIFNNKNFSAVLKVITKGKKSLVCNQTYSMLKWKFKKKTIEMLPTKIHCFFTTTLPIMLYYESTCIPMTCLFLVFTN